MPNKRYNIVSPREGGDGNTYWTTLGVGFETKNGDGINCVLNAYPVPNEKGEVRFYLFPANKKTNSGKQGGTAQDSSGADDLNDEIPF